VSSTTVTGLTNGTAYTFTVTATNAVGTSTASAPSNGVTPVAAATVPGAPTAVTASAGDAQASVKWTAPASDGGSPINGYTVTSSPVGGSTTVLGPATSATVTGLTNGTAYTFTVTATNAVGTSTASAPSSGVTPVAAATVPGAPTAVTASAGDAQASVKWTAPASDGGSPITAYTVTSSPVGGSTTVLGPATSATVTGLTNGTAYTFTVTATNAVGTSTASAPSNGITPAAAASPDLALTETHIGSFTVGTNSSYTLGVSNVGSGPTTSPITLTDTLPSGLSFVSAAGTNWSCSAALQTVTCSSAGPLAPAANSSVVLTVAVASAAVPSVTNTATVSAAGDANPANNSATDPTTVNPAPLIQSLASPQRLIDTRAAGGPIATGASRCFVAAGLAGIPADAAAVVLNVTAVGYRTPGWLTVFPNGQPKPATSTLNFDTGEYAIANGAIMRLGTGGQVCVNVGTVNSAPGNSQVILDATGFLSASALAQLPMLASPQRAVDTRLSNGPIATGQSRCFTIAGVAGVPADAAAVVFNVTAVSQTARGWLTVYPNGQPVPAASTLDFDPSEYAIADGTIVSVGTAGQVCVGVGTVNSAPGSSNVILDVTGYLTSAGLVQLPMLASPLRVADTHTLGGAIQTGSSRCFTVAGVGGIPANAVGAVVTVAAVGYGTSGWLTAYPDGNAVPTTSTVNFDTSQWALANGAIIPIGAGGRICVNVGTVGSAPGSSDVLLDVLGYFTP
jgi:hypothetical protein